jgi:hypothetical protein
MFNRHIDGLNTNMPASKDDYSALGLKWKTKFFPLNFTQNEG